MSFSEEVPRRLENWPDVPDPMVCLQESANGVYDFHALEDRREALPGIFDSLEEGSRNFGRHRSRGGGLFRFARLGVEGGACGLVARCRINVFNHIDFAVSTQVSRKRPNQSLRSE